MNAIALKQQLCTSLIAQSGLEKKRAYLGMSGIGRCGLQLYRQYLNGRSEMSDHDHWQCWLGLLFEAGMIRLLCGDQVVRRPAEVVAGWDERFRGHVDFQTTGGDLVEIKSVDWPGFKKVQARGAKPPHRAQVQLYLRHGPWKRAFLVYVARDVPWSEWNGIPIWVLEERPENYLADRLDDKARKILWAIDGIVDPPACDCGRCR